MDSVSLDRIYIQRLRPNSDLLEELEALASQKAIALGQISGIGALKKASLGIFLPREARYAVKEFAGELEICHLSGNISLKEGKPFVHAHLVISDPDGRAHGGHLLPGCQIFIAEIILLSFRGGKLERLPQADFPGLSLWPLEEGQES